MSSIKEAPKLRAIIDQMKNVEITVLEESTIKPGCYKASPVTACRNASSNEGSVSTFLISDSKDFTASATELKEIIASINLHDDATDKEITTAEKLVKAYLYKNEPEFANVLDYRIRGWTQNKEKGDAFFKIQRQRADTSSVKQEGIFIDIMVGIAKDMHQQTSALNPEIMFGKEFRVLDICMAPGGFTKAVLNISPEAKCHAITLPEEQGGHRIVLPVNLLASKPDYVDVTLVGEYREVKNFLFQTVSRVSALKILLGKSITKSPIFQWKELSNKDIPATHPDFDKFYSLRPSFDHYRFNLIFGDAVVLRTQARGDYRRKTEHTRLVSSEIIMALKKIVNGGTIVMLLHKVDSWRSASVLCAFSRFSEIELFKPERAHATRSSFYMIAKKVDTEKESFKLALKYFQDVWYQATFGGKDGLGDAFIGADDDEAAVMMLLTDFGAELSKLGRKIWSIQAKALSRSPYAGDRAI